MDEAKKRRETVPAACEKCRRRKVKCDGRRPCKGCVKLNLGSECVYNARGGETHRQAQKRKYDDLASLHDALRAVDERDALAILRRIRAGDSLEAILAPSPPASSPAHPSPTPPPYPASRASQPRSSSHGHGRGSGISQPDAAPVPPPMPPQVPPQVDKRADALNSAILAVRNPQLTLDVATDVATVERERDVLDHVRHERHGHGHGHVDAADGSEPISADLLIDIINELKGKRRAVGLDIWQRLRRHNQLPPSLPPPQSNVDARRSTTPAEVGGRVALMQTLLRGSATLPAIVHFLESKDWTALDFGVTIQASDAVQNLVRVEPGGHRVYLRGSTPPIDALVDHTIPPVTSLAVPATPWTSITDDSRLVSHLISVFLVRDNSCWRCLEQDPFLQDMRRGQLDSEYCSPLLVNAVCALACLKSTEQGAFTKPGDWFRRGQHFYDEAIRLWLNESGRPLITTIQALGILCISACYCAKDRFGVSLLSVAMQMNQYLPWPTSNSTQGSHLDVAVRVRTCAAWAIHNLNIGCMMGLYKPAAPIDPRLGLTPNLPDEVQTWSAFPKESVVYEFRPNALLRERCMLFRLCAEMTHLLFGDQRSSDVRYLHKAIQTLDERFRQWRDNLPTDLRYDKARPAPIYELHLHFLCATTILWTAFDDFDCVSTSSSSLDHTDAVPADIRKAANLRKYEHVLILARCLADHRTKYTLESASAYCFQAAAVASFSALRMLAEYRNASSITEDLPEDASRCLESAFEESFRCILGTGAQLAMAAGVARMILQTGNQLNVLPRPVIRALTAIRPTLEDGYRPRDTSSAYVNYALARRSKADEDARMDQLLKKADNMSI